MSITVIACIYAMFAISAGGALAWFTFKDCRSDVVRIVIGWLLITAIPFLVSIPSLCFILMGIVLYGFKPKDDKNKLLLYYMAFLPVLPAIVTWRLSFPFVPSLRLFNFHYVDLINLLYMLPIAFAARQRRPANVEPHIAFATKIGKFSIYVVLYMLLLDFRDTSVTDGVRKFIHSALSLLVIIMAFRHWDVSRETIQSALKGLLIAGCMMAVIAVVQQLKLWKLYTAIPYSIASFDAIYGATEIRGGSIRSPSTMYPLPFGLYMAICIGIMTSLVARRTYGFFALIALGAYLWGLALSNSRGAMMGLMVMLGIMVLYSERFAGLRRLMYKMRWVVVTAVVVMLALFFDLQKLSEMDEHGTFQYRVELIQNSMVVFKENMMFGSSSFRLHPALEASRQGQGIIDVTNALLSMLLNYGLIGLLGFLAIFYLVVRQLLKERLLAEQQHKSDLEYEFRMLASVLLGYILVIITVSFVDRIEQYYWILIGLGATLVKNKTQYVAQTNDK